MKRPERPRRGYSLQDIEQSLHAIYAAHEARQATPNHPVNSGKRKDKLEKGMYSADESQANESAAISARLNTIANSTKPTQGEVLKARGDKPMSQDEFKKRLK